jgi:hypothetical protein
MWFRPDRPRPHTIRTSRKCPRQAMSASRYDRASILLATSCRMPANSARSWLLSQLDTVGGKAGCRDDAVFKGDRRWSASLARQSQASPLASDTVLLAPSRERGVFEQECRSNLCVNRRVAVLHPHFHLCEGNRRRKPKWRNATRRCKKWRSDTYGCHGHHLARERGARRAAGSRTCWYFGDQSNYNCFLETPSVNSRKVSFADARWGSGVPGLADVRQRPARTSQRVGFVA